MTPGGEDPVADHGTPEPQRTRNKLVFNTVVTLIGLGCVALAFRLRWADSDETIHPFPFLLGVGLFAVFGATRSTVRTITALHRMRRGGGE